MTNQIIRYLSFKYLRHNDNSIFTTKSLQLKLIIQIQQRIYLLQMQLHRSAGECKQSVQTALQISARFGFLYILIACTCACMQLQLYKFILWSLMTSYN